MSWEKGMTSVLFRCAKSHFQLALSLVEEFTETFQQQEEAIQEEPQESLLCPQAIMVMEQLSKLQPHLSREENCSLLAQCCQGIVCLRHLEQMEEEGEVAAAPACA
ncbi:maestro heat-like repeat-containing protein family member 7 isoform X1 [Apteryx mantelli]|uniref:Maestro heat-like repeat-containing protein family member 7 isoform X1 n=1 Tax=Apteryx mantelli TaxID=2696672 RepID=A0ABM4EL94_9AVES